MNDFVQSPLFERHIEKVKHREARQRSTQLILGTGEPEKTAEGVQIGKELNVPAQSVMGAPKLFKDMADTKRASTAIAAAPNMAQWLGDPINGAIAKDDLDNLTWFEREMGPGARAIGRGTRRAAASPNTAAAMLQGDQAADIGRTYDEIYAEELAKFPGSESNPRIMADARRAADLRFDRVNGLGEAERRQLIERGANNLASANRMIEIAQDIPMSGTATAFRDGTLANSENTIMGTLGAFLDDPIGGAAFIAETAAETLPILAGAAGVTLTTRSPATGVATMSTGSFLLENSTAAIEFLNSKGIALDIGEPEVAALILQDRELMAEAQELGVTRGLIIALFDAVSGGVAGQQLANSPAGDVVAQGLAQVLLGGGGEAAAQQATTGEIDAREVVIEGLAELATAPVEVAGVGGRGLIRDIGRYARSGETAQLIDQIDAMSDQSKVRERSADKFQAALEAARLDDNALHVPAEDMTEYFQSRGVDLDDETLQAWGIEPSDYAEKLASGGDLSIPIEKYAAQISGTEDAAWFRNHAVFNVDEMSVAEAEDFNSRVRDIFDEEFDLAREAAETERDLRAADVQIYDQIFSDLRAAGRSPDVADNEARVWASFWRTMGERYGEDALALARSMGVRIQGPQTPDARRRRNLLDVQLNTLRSKGDRALQPRGEGVLDFVRGLGGVRDLGGDIEALDPPAGVVGETRAEIIERTSQPRLGGGLDLTGRGLGLDEIGRRLIEEGYHLGGQENADGTTIDEAALALELISEAVAGRETFRPGEGPDQDLVDLNDAISERGIDLAVSNDEIAAALDADADGQEFFQFAGPQSETADLHMLASAKERIDGGESAERVRQETGWFRGTDGKWRYEISDDDASISGAIEDEVLPPFEKDKLAEWETDYDDLFAESGIPLRDILDHEKLYAAYPDLALIPIFFDPGMDARGQVSGMGTEMRLNHTEFSNHDEVLSTILHEVQHLIQRREGFARGGNLEITGEVKKAVARLVRARELDVERWIDSNSKTLVEAQQKAALAGYANMFKSFEALINYAQHSRPSSVFRLIRNEAGWLYSDVIQNASDEGLARRARDLDRTMWNLPKRHKMAERNAFLSEYAFELAQILRKAIPEKIWDDFKADERKLNSIVKAYEREASKARKKLVPLGEIKAAKSRAIELQEVTEFKSPFEVYQALAGETEARNTQARASMSDDERAETSPGQTADVNEGEQIVVFPDGEIDVPYLANVEESNFRELNQDKRGSIQLPRGGLTEGQTVINLFESADLSTFLHESGHFFLEAFSALANSPDAPQAMKDDLATIHKFLEVENSDAIGTDQHETWARGFEAYLLEGKAPSLELASAFARFKAWLTRIYRTVRGLDVKITDEIREVMDRMLATDDEIQAMREDLNMRPLFTSDNPIGMSEGDFATYQRLAQRSADQADQRLLKRTMEKVRRETLKWFKDEKSAVRAEVEASANKMPVYRLTEMLANQRWLGETETDIPDIQIDRDALVTQFGEGVLPEINRGRLGGKRAIYAKGGERPELVAEMFGFASIPDMIETLQNAGKRTDFINAEVDRIMVERHGDPLNDGTIEEAAAEAVHSQQQAATVTAETRAIAKRLGRPTRNIKARIYRQRARAMLGRMSVREASRPAAFLAAERKAAKTAERAFARLARQSGQNSEAVLATAMQAKEQQLINSFLYQESVEFEKRLRRGREKMRSYQKRSVREKLDGGYIEQIDHLLERFDFRQRGRGQIERAETLRAFIDRMIEEGRQNDLSIDDRLLDEARRVHYTRLSVDELLGLFDTVQNLDHMGRFKHKLVERQRRRDLNESAAKVSDLVRDRFGTGKTDKQSGDARNFFNLLMRVDTIAADIDGQEIGTFYDEIKRGLDEGAAIEQKMNVDAATKINDLFSVYSAKEKADLNTARSIPGGNGQLWTKQQVLALALNTGNAQNLQRVLDPRVHRDVRLTQSQMEATLDTLDKRDWDFIQGVWDFIDTYWADLSEVTERRTGVKPKRVEATPVATKFGTYRGGYYPIGYDRTKSKKAAQDAESAFDRFLSAGRGAPAKVADGMTLARQNTGGGRALHYDFFVMMAHVRDTTRVIALSEAVDNSYRVLNHENVVNAFQDGGVSHLHRTLNLFLQDISTGPVYNDDPINGLSRILKNNFTLSRLAFNLKTVALQVTGLGQSAATIGKFNLLKGFAEYRKRPNAIAKEVMEKSPFMAERQTTFQKDIFDQANDLRLASPIAGRGRRAKNFISALGFAPIVKTQFYAVDMPTWIGAYQAEIARNGGDEAKAVHFADRMVDRSQGGGLMTDRNALERGTVSRNMRQSDFVRLWTTLGGYMVTKMNRGFLTVRGAQRDIRGADTAGGKVLAAASAASDLALLYVFEAAFMGLAYSLLADDPDDEELKNFAIRELAGAVFGGIPFVRESVASFNGYGAGGVLSSALEIPSSVWEQATQGENDKAFRRAISDAVGFATGMPTTAAMRIIEEIAEGEDGSLAEAALGRNPVQD